MRKVKDVQVYDHVQVHDSDSDTDGIRQAGIFLLKRNQVTVCSIQRGWRPGSSPAKIFNMAFDVIAGLLQLRGKTIRQKAGIQSEIQDSFG